MRDLAVIHPQFGHGYFTSGVFGDYPVVFERAGRAELLKFFSALGFTNGAEIGVWRGGFSEAMCKALPGLQLLCVDAWGNDPTYHEAKQDASWAKVRRQAEQRLKPYGCVIDARLSTDAARDVPDGSLDFVHIDGNHGREQVYADLAAWTPKVRLGGIVAGHDYREFPGRPMIRVKEAVDAFVKDHGIREWFVLSREECPSFCWVVK
jgi:hypothetical protein